MPDVLPPADIELPSCALFLDLDGTLIEFGPSPMAVDVPPALITLLQRLEARVEGALAIVTGRQIATVDELIEPLVLPVAGLHGAERRDAAGEWHRIDGVIAADISAIESSMRAFAQRHDGVLVEDKGVAVALHYRSAPHAAAAVSAFAAELATSLPAGLTLQRGHMVVEVRPAAADKGRAIATFMGEHPFAGRRPMFLGDDRTDEHGFEYVNDVAGRSIKVGDGDTLATARLADPRAVRAWLTAVLDENSRLLEN